MYKLVDRTHRPRVSNLFSSCLFVSSSSRFFIFIHKRRRKLRSPSPRALRAFEYVDRSIHRPSSLAHFQGPQFSFSSFISPSNYRLDFLSLYTYTQEIDKYLTADATGSSSTSDRRLSLSPLTVYYRHPSRVHPLEVAETRQLRREYAQIFLFFLSSFLLSFLSGFLFLVFPETDDYLNDLNLAYPK